MCGRFNDHLPKMQGWAELLSEWPDYERSFNRGPTTQIAAFRSNHGELMRWGMIPPWSKEFNSKYATFNARVESVGDKPTFKHAWKHNQRCLVPMAGYYEWVGDKGNKQPVYITDRDAGCIVAAGLYETWGDDDQLSCTIITTPADQELSHIHPRMPVMLMPEQAQSWLDGDVACEQITRPNVIYFPVSKAVGNVRNNNPELIKPIDTK